MFDVWFLLCVEQFVNWEMNKYIKFLSIAPTHILALCAVLEARYCFKPVLSERRLATKNTF